MALMALAALPASAQVRASGDADAPGAAPEARSVAADSALGAQRETSGDRVGVGLWGLRPVRRLEASGAATRTLSAEADSAQTALLRDVQAEPLALALAEPDTTDEEIRKRPTPISVFGYYRLFLYGRNMTEPYPDLTPYERVYGVGDGYREPMLSLNVLGRPNGRSSFGTELFVFTPYDGSEDVETNTLSLNLGINFYGNFRTEAGNFGVRAGGIHWYNLSPFTIGVYQPLERFSIFNRTPWEGVTGTAKHDSYFLTGQANPGDERSRTRPSRGDPQRPGASRGLRLRCLLGQDEPDGGLPNAATDPNGTVPGEGDVPDYSGFAGDSRVLPSFITGGRIERAFGDDLFALNSIYSYRTLDSLTADRRDYQVHTGSFDANVANVNLSGELGASKFDSPDYTSKWGEALMVRAKTPEALTMLPLDVQVYQIGRHFFNENSEIATGNNPQLRTDPRCEVTAGSGAGGGGITQVNQLEHNRRGVNFNTAWGAGPAQLAVGWGMATSSRRRRLHSSTPTASTGWRSRGSTTRSPPRPSAPPPSGLGAEVLRLPRRHRACADDRRGAGHGPAAKPELFRAVDLQGKARARLLDRSLYFFYLGSFGSAEPDGEGRPDGRRHLHLRPVPRVRPLLRGPARLPPDHLPGSRKRQRRAVHQLDPDERPPA